MENFCETIFCNQHLQIYFGRKNSFIFEKIMKDHVFKKCRSRDTGHECLLTMKKPQVDFICNESRTSVVNKEFSKFRCNGLLVVSIFDLVLKVELNSIFHTTNITYGFFITEYTVGLIVTPNHFDENLEQICAAGIHYFLTRRAAECYNLEWGLCNNNENGELSII
jgi:hypothetical protein